MSIIYEALKKVEGNITDADAVVMPKPRRLKKLSKRRVYLLYVLAGCFVLFLANIAFLKFSGPRNSMVKNLPPSISGNNPQDPAQANPETKIAEAPKPQEPVLPSFVLNGLFFSGNDGYALVNNQIVREGDVVDGAEVERIIDNAVELKCQGKEIKLTYTK